MSRRGKKNQQNDVNMHGYQQTRGHIRGISDAVGQEQIGWYVIGNIFKANFTLCPGV